MTLLQALINTDIFVFEFKVQLLLTYTLNGEGNGPCVVFFRFFLQRVQFSRISQTSEHFANFADTKITVSLVKVKGKG